jgi:NADH dehydrogenase/NADH:ubiquinone oxidoreductase subunit G
MPITIDGKAYDITPGQTVLDVTRTAGVPIPTLCLHDGLEPYGGCRVCLVEVTAGGPPGLHSSCTLLAADGMEVLTASDRVLKARRLVAELLLARAPQSDPIRRLASQLGVTETDLSPRDELCILCGRCVRACAQLGVYAIDWTGRGIERRVDVPFGEPSDVCIGCRACFNVCPTGAIESKFFPDRVEIPTFRLELEHVMCAHCGKPTVPRRAWEHLQSRLPEHLRSDSPICPACRRRGQLSRVVGGTEESG